MSQAVTAIGTRAEPELDLTVWLECYLADCEARGLSPRTIEWYRDRGSRLVEQLAALGVEYPAQLSRRAVSRLFVALRGLTHRGRPLEPQTILGYWQVGKGFATFLIGEEVHPEPNPFSQFGKPKVPEKAMWAPSAEECRAMLQVPDRRSVMGIRDRVILLLLLDSGIRVSALRGIRVEAADLRDRRLRVIEKGRRERVVPFGFEALRWLRRYLVAARLGEDDFLFPGTGWASHKSEAHRRDHQGLRTEGRRPERPCVRPRSPPRLRPRIPPERRPPRISKAAPGASFLRDGSSIRGAGPRHCGREARDRLSG